MLASLNPGTIVTYEPNRDEPLDLSEAEIFNQTSRDAPDPSWCVEAIRFAWLCVFRRDIDRNYRLSTMFENDQLRLDLLLTLFVGVWHLFWKDGEAGRAASLPTLPDHLCRAFKPRELCRLLTSIAISAHRCQRGRIVGDAVRLTEGLADAGRDGAEPLDPLLLIRLHCAEIDTAVLAGVYEPTGARAETDCPQLSIEWMTCSNVASGRATGGAQAGGGGLTITRLPGATRPPSSRRYGRREYILRQLELGVGIER